MKKMLMASAVALAVISVSAQAVVASENSDAKLEAAPVGAVLGTTEADVRSALEAKGFTVAEVEIEDDEIEAEVKLDGKSYEIEVDAKTGKITETELEEDDD